MASPFDDLDADLSAAINDTFATDAAYLTPRTQTAYSEAAADPARPAKPVLGIFSAGAGQDTIQGRAKGKRFDGATRLSELRAEFWISAAAVASLGYEIETGDLLVITDRPDLPPYRVSNTQGTDMGDVNCLLTPEDTIP